MAWQYTPYTVALLLATLVGLVATVLCWQRREDTAARWASYNNAAITLWAALHLVVVSSTIYEVKLAAYKLALVNIGLLIAAVFGYVVCFTGRAEWLTRRRLAVLCAAPLATLLGLFTNHYHGLWLIDPALETGGAYDQLTYTSGPLWYAFGSLYVGIVAIGLALLGQMFVRVRNVYRKRTFLVFVVIVLLGASTLPAMFQVGLVPHFLELPVVYLFTSVLALLTMTSVRFVRAVPIDRILARLRPGSGTVVPLARDYVMEEVDNGIVVLDTNQRIVDCNSTGKRMIGADRPMGKHVSDAAKFDRLVDADALSQAIENDEDLVGFEGEYWIDPMDVEGKRCYDIRISSMDSGGDRVGTVILLQDVTEQKRREETLRDREEELTRQKANLQSQKATLERQNERLEAQTRKLEHQNERLDQFASIVSHDLRNPLNVAEGYLGEIRDAAADEDRTVDPEHVDEVTLSTERMGTIIDDALTLARQGKAITETEPVDVGTVATDAWEHVDTGGATLEVALAVDGVDGDDRAAGDASDDGDDECEGLLVEGSRSRLVTVFENLFRNAVEHGAEPRDARDSREGEGGLTVRVGRLDGGNGFYVADDGPGIPEDEREEIFEHGYTTNSEGTGLGLSIVQDVIKAHGWGLEVAESEAGGARFDVVDVELATDEGDEISIADDEWTTTITDGPGDASDR